MYELPHLLNVGAVLQVEQVAGRLKLRLLELLFLLVLHALLLAVDRHLSLPQSGPLGDDRDYLRLVLALLCSRLASMSTILSALSK